MADADEWLVFDLYEGDKLIYDDGRYGRTTDAEALLTEMFGAFASENCLRRPDLASLRADLRHGVTVLAAVDGRDW